MGRLIEAKGTIVGVFGNRRDAEEAIRALKADGFNDTHIGLAASVDDESPVVFDESAKTAVTGAAVGLGTGALWGLGIVAGLLPGIGPAIAGGTLAAILASAAVGASAAGIAGAFLGLGFGKEDAEHIENEFKAGKVIVTVKAGSRADTARSILERYRWVEAGAPEPIHS